MNLLEAIQELNTIEFDESLLTDDLNQDEVISKLNHCPNCGGSGKYEVEYTSDGFKEYRCSYCGGILYRVNPFEEVKKFDKTLPQKQNIDTSSIPDLENLLKYYNTLQANSKEDLNAAKDMVKLLRKKADKEKDIYKCKAYIKLFVEYRNMFNDLKKFYKTEVPQEIYRLSSKIRNLKQKAAEQKAYIDARKELNI